MLYVPLVVCWPTTAEAGRVVLTERNCTKNSVTFCWLGTELKAILEVCAEVVTGMLPEMQEARPPALVLYTGLMKPVGSMTKLTEDRPRMDVTALRREAIVFF